MSMFKLTDYVVVISLATASVFLGNLQCAQAQPAPPQAPCPPLSRPRSSPPPGAAQVVVVLPKALDPRGCPIRTRRGTRVFAVQDDFVTWTDVRPDGAGVGHLENLTGGAVAIQRSGSKLYVQTRDGQRLVYPGNAVIRKGVIGRDIDLMFVSPGQNVPLFLRGRNPDYIVP